MSERGFLGGLCDNDELLWFIIIFLLLFYCKRPLFGCGPVAPIKGC